MSKPIKVSFEWNKELALTTSKLYYDYDMRHSNKRYMGWFFVGLVQFGIVGALKHDSYGILFVSTFLVAYWYYGRWYFRKRMLYRFYEKNTPENVEVKFTIDDEGIHTQEKLVSWDEILKVLELEEGIFLQKLDEAYYFENSSFTPRKGKTALLAMAKEKGKI